MKAVKFSILFVFFLLAFPPFIFSQEIKDKQDELSGIKKKIEEEKKKIEETKRVEKTVLGELADIDKQLGDKEKELKILVYEIDNTNSEIKVLEGKIEELEVMIEDMRQLIEERLVALYKLGGAGYAPVLFSAENYSDVKRRVKYLSVIVESDRELFLSYRTNVSALSNNLDELKRKKSELSLLKEGVSRKKLQIEKDKVNRNKYLEDVKGKRSSYEAAIRELEEAKQRLTALIEKLIKEREEKERKEKERLEREKSTGHTSPSVGGAFLALKGKLPYPTEGSVITKYGRGEDPKYKNPIFNKGIEIKAPEGTKFFSVSSGEVIYVDYFQGYGNMIIIDHGDSYYTIYAHAKEIFKEVGDKVVAKEVIGTVGDSASLKGPCLYFEIRHHGSTTDPETWLAKD
jgi:septal ring factor EnvC (AmiA/AmiB activator)